jgi:hypothetical protein
LEVKAVKNELTLSENNLGRFSYLLTPTRQNYANGRLLQKLACLLVPMQEIATASTIFFISFPSRFLTKLQVVVKERAFRKGLS